MELKCGYVAYVAKHGYRSNCTFMELKFFLMKMKKRSSPSSNCTFMELKYFNLQHCAAKLLKF